MQEIALLEQVFGQLIQQLVLYPERVTSVAVLSDLGQTIRIGVDTEDLGRVIGRRGQTARSLRILLSAISANKGCKVMLDISENTSTNGELKNLV